MQSELVNKWQIAAALAACASQPAFAQNACDSILSQGIYDTSDNLLTNDRIERFARHICSSGGSSTGAGGSIVYGGVPIGASYNASSHSAVCDDVRSQRRLSSRNVQLVRTVNSQLVAAWSQCVSQASSVNGLNIWAKAEFDPNWIEGEVRFRNPVADDPRTSIITLDIPAQIRERSCRVSALNRARLQPEGSDPKAIRVDVDRDASFRFRCQRRSTQPASFTVTNSLVDGTKEVLVRELVLWPRMEFQRQAVASRCAPIGNWTMGLSPIQITVSDFAPGQVIYLRNVGGNGYSYNRDLPFSSHNSSETSTAALGRVALRRRAQPDAPSPRDIKRDGLVISARGVAPRLLLAVNSKSGCGVNKWTSRISSLRLNFVPANEGSFRFGADIDSQIR